VRKDGTKFPIEVRAREIEYEERKVRVAAIMDVTEHKLAEEALRKSRDELEQRVHERTAELMQANERLRIEIEERKQVERALREREAELETRSQELEEANSALRILLSRVDGDKEQLEQKVLVNVKDLTLPYLEKLKMTQLSPDQRTYVNILESNLNDVVSPFAHKLSSKYLNLTPAEIQVATLIKAGRRSKEIAELLRLSVRTIEVHRQSIRTKLGLKNRKANLRSHLLSLP
jgi:DNA-binding CsgD family transcriptional regulator